MIVSTKSGTNEFHGSLFAYNEVAALEAANFFATSLPKAPFVRNEYGGSLGGPIKRDKLFFFGSFEGYKLRSSSTVQSAQPTPALLEGNFDGLPPVIDPSTGQPFPGNQVPSDRISPISQALFKYFDTPNLTSSAPGGLGTNFVSNIPQIQDNNRWEGRVDYNADSKDTFSARYYMVRQIPQLFPWGTTDKVGSVYWDDVNQNLVANYTRIISPKLVNLATFGWAREWDTLKSQNTNFDPSTLIPGLPASLPGLGGVPTISITAFTGLSDWGGSGDTIPTYEFHDTLTWVSGPHILKGGFSYLRYQFLNYQNISPSHGTFSFTGRYTGNPFADFLLGDISSDGYPISGVSAAATNDRYGLWVQDSWKAKPNLTLNLGLRYDLPTLYVNTPGNMANWYPSTNTVVAIKGAYDPSPFSALPIVSGQNAGINAGNYVGNDLRQLSPRVGIAYMPLGTSRLVLRGGYGLYYEMWPWNYGSFEIASNPPYGGAIYFEPQAGAVPTLTFANAFPAGAGSVPSGIGLTALARNYSYPASHEWNLTLESQVSANVALRASYLGTETQHASLTYNINDPIPAPGPVQPRRPFQPFGPINYYQNGGTSNLQQLQLSAIRRFSSNLSFEVEYSWTKELDLAGNQQGTPIDNQNIRLDRGNDPFIRPQYLVANYVYNLPFGSGQRFLSSLRGPLNQIIGGWQTSGILTLGSGLPFSVKFDSSVEGWPSSRADIIGNPHVSNPSLTQWFNPAAYALPEPFAYGNSAPYSLFGPGYSNWDMAMFKEFRLGERFRLQFRSEFFNTLNHPSFSNPASDISAPAQIGQIFSTTSSPRSIQFGLRLGF